MVKGLLSLKQAAEALGVSQETARRMVEGGVLTAYRVPGRRRYFVPRAAVEAILRGELEAKKDPAGQGGE